MMWFSWKQLTEIPCMPKTRQGIHKKAISEGWQVQRNGKINEYHISSLPIEAQAYLKGDQPQPEETHQKEEILPVEQPKAKKQPVAPQKEEKPVEKQQDQWFSIKEIADLTRRDRSAILKKLKKENCSNRTRTGRGGGAEYALSGLPEGIRAEIIEAQNPQEEIEEDEDEETDFLPAISQSSLPVPRLDPKIEPQDKYEQIILARDFLLKICDRFGTFSQIYGWSKEQQYIQFANYYNNHLLGEFGIYVPEHIYEIIPRTSKSQLYRDRKIASERGIRSLTYAYGSRKGKGKIDSNPKLQEAIKACLAAYQCDVNYQQIPLLLKEYFDFALEDIPSYHQVRRWVVNFAQECPIEFTLLKDKNKAKSYYAPAFGKRGIDILRPNQVWELDSSPTDINLKYIDPVTGEVTKRRYALIGAIDVYTRITKYVVSLTSNSEAILLLLRECIVDWGVPETVRTDNGKDYVSYRTLTFLNDIGISQQDIKLCLPGQPQQKPFIERSFRTLQHGEMKLLPGFVGHSVEQRARKRSHAEFDEKTVELELTAEELQEWLDQWVLSQRSKFHTGIKCRPIERLTQAVASGWLKKEISNPRTLDFLLMQGKNRTVQRKGIQLNNRFYVAPELHGLQEVHVRFDPKDPSRIYVYDSESLQNFICEALWRDDPGIELAEIAARATEVHKAIEKSVTAHKKAGKRLQKQVADDPYRLVSGNNIDPLIRAQEFTNEAIETLTEAASTEPRKFITEPTPQEIEAHEQTLAILNDQDQEPQEDPRERYERLWAAKHFRMLTSEEEEEMLRFERLPEGRIVREALESLMPAYGVTKIRKS